MMDHDFDDSFVGSCSAVSLGGIRRVGVTRGETRTTFVGDSELAGLRDEIAALREELAAAKKKLVEGPQYQCEYCGHTYYDVNDDGECDDCGGTVVPK